MVGRANSTRPRKSVGGAKRNSVLTKEEDPAELSRRERQEREARELEERKEKEEAERKEREESERRQKEKEEREAEEAGKNDDDNAETPAPPAITGPRGRTGVCR